MPIAGPVNAPSSLSLITAVRIRFMQMFKDAYTKNRAYSDFEKVVYYDDPTGDVIYNIYAEPMLPLRAWYADRPMSSTDFRFWTQAVRTFGDGMQLDVDDLKDDANPAKRMMYLQAAEQFASAAVALWPSLFAETLVKGISKIWLPDGQQILSVHPFSPSNASLGSFRNYYANNAQGGNAAMALNYANLLTLLDAGMTMKSPKGLDFPTHYTHLCVWPGAAKMAQRLVSFDRLPVQEIVTGATGAAGGDAINGVKALYAPEVVEIANLPKGVWGLIDATTEADKPIAIKKREEIKWQYTSGGNIAGMPASDDGLVTEEVFTTNKTKYGPKARGEGFYRNWWRVVLADGNNVPVTDLNIVS